jgi:hypothetical protein
VGFTFLQKKKRKKKQYWIHKVFRKREEEGDFQNLFGRLKDNRHIFKKYFRLSFSKFENLEQLLRITLKRRIQDGEEA